MFPDLPILNFDHVYKSFHISSCEEDCGKQCAPFNKSGLPFCCDHTQAIPAAYRQEWDYLAVHSSQWQLSETQQTAEDLPDHMLLLSCQGPQKCHRPTRALSCRQFPFFPYITADDRFIGLAYEWVFEEKCWLINHLDAVTTAYRSAFMQTYDHIFDHWMFDFESYAIHSEEMRQEFIKLNRRIPILHRNGRNYLLSPGSDRLAKAHPKQYKKFGPYKNT